MDTSEEEHFIGGVASVGITRTARSFKSSYYVQTGGPVGYGIYLTDRRLIGVSYRKTVSKAYYPAYALFLIWIISLVALVAYAILTGAQQIPPLPFVMSLAVVALVLLVYWGPKQASKKVDRSTITSIEGLRNATSDIVLDRTDIHKVTVQPRLITFNLKSGETHTFLSAISASKLQQLLSLLKEFCSLAPKIEMTLSDASGKNVEGVVGPSIGAPMIRIWADFTALGGGLIPLDFKGSLADIRRQNVDLKEGLHIVVYDDSYQAEATVVKVGGEWYGRIIEGTGRDAYAKPPPLDG